MKTGKRTLALLLSLMMLLALLPMAALAEEGMIVAEDQGEIAITTEEALDEDSNRITETADAAPEITAEAEEAETDPDGGETFSAIYINPLYADVLTEDDLEQPTRDTKAQAADTVYTSVSKAGTYMRGRMKAREKTIKFRISDSVKKKDGFYFDIDAAATAHTGKPTEGDYILWQYGGWSVQWEKNNGSWLVTYTVTYYTTATQEKEMDTAVKKLLSNLAVSDMTNAQKIFTIYDWVTENVVYDRTHLENDSYTLQFTAYAALINGTAVCQGYSVLMYRLLLASGIDCRVITGKGNGGNHAWNIIKLGDYYYNADSTWDARNDYPYDYYYEWFMVCNANFPDHVRDSEYTTSAFNKKYPMGKQDYDFSNRFHDVIDKSLFYYEYINRMADKGVVGGYADGSFRPMNNCNRAAVVTFLWRLAGRPEPWDMATFDDMTDNDEFNKAISWAAEEGITTGYDDNTFRPWNTCNRAAIVTFLWRYAGEPYPQSMATFKDMTGNTEFDLAISWAAENEITTGWDDNTFRPWNTCNRLAVVSFLCRYEDNWPGE